MSDYLNYIQLISGICAAALIFAGIFISVKKLNPEKYETIPVKTTVISTALIIAGLLCYTLTKTCTNMTVVTEEQYELGTLYFASLEEVIKLFGFIVFVPLLFRLFKPKSHRNAQSEEAIAEETEEN
ncbi:MAG: hypothetical protein IKG03_07675 [Clostridiales bacterium]|nr:hypothetical protein [Clostridiales bacterium]